MKLRDKCIHCKRDRGRHNAVTKACPIGRYRRVMFSIHTRFEAKK